MRRIRLCAIGSVDAEPLRAALLAMDEDDGAARLTVVATDDYARPELHQFEDRPWMLVKPQGRVIWVGPKFQPGRGPCLRCLRRRLRAQRPFDGSGAVPALGAAAAAMAALQIHRALQTDDLVGRLLTLDLATLESRQHGVRPYPGCCEIRVHSTIDESGRGLRQLHDVLADHVSPLTGIVTRLRTRAAGGLYVANARGSLEGAAPRDISRVAHGGGSGRGESALEARVGALCECLEVYSASWCEERAGRRARIDALDAEAIAPTRLVLASERQYRDRAQWNRRWPTKRHRVPRPFDAQREIEWTRGWSLTRDRPCWLPSAWCWLEYPEPLEDAVCFADTSGVSAGHDLQQATLNGFVELAEREAVGLWWYARARRPAVDLDAFGDPLFERVRKYFRGLGRELWVLDVTADLGVPSYVAVSPGADGTWSLGFGAHLQPRVGVRRALLENLQRLPTAEALPVADLPHLWPGEGTSTGGGDFADCIARAEALGLEVIVLDMTRTDVGLPVARVVIPGLRSFTPRFAPGRLYDVPLRLGWVPRALTEDELNPWPLNA